MLWQNRRSTKIQNVCITVVTRPTSRLQSVNSILLICLLTDLIIHPNDHLSHLSGNRTYIATGIHSSSKEIHSLPLIRSQLLASLHITTDWSIDTKCSYSVFKAFERCIRLTGPVHVVTKKQQIQGDIVGHRAKYITEVALIIRKNRSFLLKTCWRPGLCRSSLATVSEVKLNNVPDFISDTYKHCIKHLVPSTKQRVSTSGSDSTLPHVFKLNKRTPYRSIVAGTI